MSGSDGGLQRRLGLGDAVAIGIGSMLGAGVFVVFAPAAALAGGGLLLAVLRAGLVAVANATALAQRAAPLPQAGGAYRYGRELLGAWPGFLAGIAFIIGKQASAAAMALAAALHLAPAGWERPLAALIVIALTAVNALGVTRTALATKLLLLIVLAVLAAVLLITIGGGGLDPISALPTLPGDWVEAQGLLAAAGLLFFAFAGYARIATLAEEVRRPERTIPRAIAISLGAVLALYLVLVIALLSVLGVDALATSTTPIAELAGRSGAPWPPLAVRLAGAAASLGALLALLSGIARTMMAMAREGDLPGRLAEVHPRFGTPLRAELVVGAVLLALVLLGGLEWLIGASSFLVLLYYAIANAAALRQRAPHRRWPRAWQGIALGACLLLAISLPWQSAAAGAGCLLLAAAARALSRRAVSD